MFRVIIFVWTGMLLLGGLSLMDRTAPEVSKVQAAQDAAVARPTLPADEARFIAVIEQAQRDYNAGANDMAKGAARPSRARAICAALGSTAVNSWVGKVARLSTNNDGRGVL